MSRQILRASVHYYATIEPQLVDIEATSTKHRIKSNGVSLTHDLSKEATGRATSIWS
jgi:hypothetical protein